MRDVYPDLKPPGFMTIMMVPGALVGSKENER
jgi:hypothetical protein